jgi:hypothetical protein
MNLILEFFREMQVSVYFEQNFNTIIVISKMNGFILGITTPLHHLNMF